MFNQKNQQTHSSGEQIRIQQEEGQVRHSARRARQLLNQNQMPFNSRSQLYEERQLNNMMAGQDAIYRRQTLFTPSQRQSQVVRPIPINGNELARLRGQQVQSSRRPNASLKARLERQDIARAFLALRWNQNDDQVDRSQLGMETQLYLNGQNLVKPDMLHHPAQSPNYEPGQSSPIEYTHEIDGLDTRLLSCIADEGSESPWYWQQGERGAFTPCQEAEMMDDYQEKQRSVRTMKSCDSSNSIVQPESRVGSESLQEKKMTELIILERKATEQVQNSNTHIISQSNQDPFQTQYTPIEADPASVKSKKGPQTMSQSSLTGQIVEKADCQEMEEEADASERQPRVVYETIREIGDGMHANIYLAQKLLILDDEVTDKQHLCVKVFKPYADTQMKGCAEEEFRVGQILRGHPNIISMHSFEQQQPITIDGVPQVRDFLTLAFCENSDLFSFMSTYGKRQMDSGAKKAEGQGLLVRDPQLLISICAQLIRGLDALHNQAGYAHLDIKLENILIADDGSLQFCDFGFATPLNSYVNRKMGTPVYMAPELHHAAEMPCKAQPTDIFSLGVLFFMLAFGAPPFHAAVNTDCYFSYLVLKPGNTDFFKYHPHTRQLFRDKKIPQSFMDLLMAMLMVEPARRVQEVGRLLEFEFLRGVESESMDPNHIMKQAVVELMHDSDSNEIKHED